MRARAIGLTVLLLVSSIVGVVPVDELGLGPSGFVQEASAEPPQFAPVPSEQVGKSEESIDPGNPPDHALKMRKRGSSNSSGGGGNLTASPGGGKQVSAPVDTGPPDHVQELLSRVPADASKHVYASRDANTTSIQFAATEQGELAIVVTDDISSAGRTIAIGAEVIENATGRKPLVATITSDEGDSYQSVVNYSAGYAHIGIEHFSTNTVTFAGEVVLRGEPAIDGTSYSYDIEAGTLDSVSDFSINVTGSTAYELEEPSAILGNGEATSITVAGSHDPLGPSGTSTPEIVLEGVENTTAFSSSGTNITSGETTSISLDGNQDPTSQEVTLTGRRRNDTETLSDFSKGDGSTTSITVDGTHEPFGQSGNAEPQVTFTGNEQTTSTSSSATGEGDGATESISVGGNVDPEGPSAGNEPEVTFTGIKSTTQNDQSGSGIAASGSDSITVNGNVDPDGPSASNLPELTVTPATSEYTQFDGSQEGDMLFIGESGGNCAFFGMQFDNPPKKITKLKVYITEANSGANANGIWLNEEQVDTSYYQDGTEVKSSWTPADSTGWQTIDLTNYTVTGTGPVTIDFSTTCGGSFYIGYDDSASSAHVSQYVSSGNTYNRFPRAKLVGEGAHNLNVSDGQGTTVDFGDVTSSTTKEFAISKDATSLNFQGSGGSLDYTLDKDDVTVTEDPSIDLDDDGSSEVTHSGTLSDGSTATYELSSLTTSTSSVGTDLTAGSVDWTINYDEVTATEDPGISVDGDNADEASYSGVLRSGETATVALAELSPSTSTLTTHTAAHTVDWTLDYTETWVTEDPAVDIGDDGTDEVTYSGILDDGETHTETVTGLSTGSNTLAFSSTAYNFDWSVSATEVTHTEDPDVDVDGDGTYEVTHTGILNPGSTQTYDVADLTLSSSSLDVVTNGGSEVNVTARYREQTKTQDPTIEVNGNSTSHTGTLDNGSTESLTVQESWIQEGTNRVNVTVSDTVSADAPTAEVTLEYRHKAEDDVSVTYSGEIWTETYNVSKTWANSKDSANLTIPFQGNVIAIRDIRRRTNQSGGFTAVDAANYSLSGTTLEVDLGTIGAGETVEIKANGTKVNVGNGAIQVLEPTTTGQKIDTKFKIDSKSAGFYIEVSGTSESEFLHYLDNESWSSPEDYAEVDSNGDQFIYAPQASAGSTARAKRLDLEVEPATGDVHVAVERANDSNPRLDIDPGDATGDDVDFIYHSTTAGETYVLDSITYDIVRSSAKAESPVTLPDDDSDEDLEIYEESDDGGGGSGGSSGGGGSGLPGGPAGPIQDPDPIANPILVLIVAVLLLAGLGYGSFRYFEDRVIALGIVGVGAVLEIFVVAEVLFPGVFTLPAGQGLREVIPAIAFITVSVALYLGYQYVQENVLGPDETVRGRAIEVVRIRGGGRG